MRHFVLYRAAPFLPKKRRGKSMLNMLFDRGCALILSCFFKSRTKCSRQGTSERLGRRKAAKRPVRYRLCGELIRGLQNLETPCKGDDFTFFLLLQKEPKSSRDFVLRPRFKTLLIMFFRDTSGSRPYTSMWCDPLFRMFWTGAKGLLQCRRKTDIFRK